ncbi:MAG: helix-turn-helix transcriptional regulator [Clostridia bacterium]|nr:helix-turn-helix transcriptional regulator [Clostridia bacterium]
MSEDGKTNNLMLNALAVSKYEQDWSSLPHSHPHLEITYVRDGLGYIKFQNDTVELRKGMLLIINSNVLHFEESDNNNALELYYLNHSSLNFNFADDYLIIPADAFTIPLGHFFKIIETTTIEKKVNWLKIISNLIEIISIDIVRFTNLKDNRAAIRHSKVYPVVKYINEHYNQDISMDELADLVYMSKSNLFRTFKKEHGITPQQYLIKARMSAALFLLNNLDLSINKIATMLNFSEPSSFIRAFKAFQGCTPYQYRLNNKQALLETTDLE